MPKTYQNTTIYEVNTLTSFMKVKGDSFNLGKVKFSFVNYDKSKSQGEQVLDSKDFYLDMNEALYLCEEILNKNLLIKLKKERDKNEKYPEAVWTAQGGINADKAKEKGRTDGMALARVLSIMPGSKKPVIFKFECGPGESTEQGLIVPKWGNKPESRFYIPTDYKGLKTFAIVLKAHIEGYIAAGYLKTGDDMSTKNK